MDDYVPSHVIAAADRACLRRWLLAYRRRFRGQRREDFAQMYARIRQEVGDAA